LWYRYCSFEVFTTIKSEASFSTKNYYAIYSSVNCIISTYVCIETWFHLKTLLSYNDITCDDSLSSECFDATILRIGISSVLGTTGSFDVSHMCLLKLKSDILNWHIKYGCSIKTLGQFSTFQNPNDSLVYLATRVILSHQDKIRN
jgi:hypothetical protein